LWKFFAGPAEEVTVTGLREEKDWAAVSRRTVERHLERLRDLHVINNLPTKGQWGKPGSRPKVLVGRFPSAYTLNPLFAGNLLTSDAIDTDTRKLLLVCQKLLLSMAEFRDCLSRIMTWPFKILGQSQEMLEIIQKIPELNVLQKGQSKNDPSIQPGLIEPSLFDEIVGTAIFKMNFCIDGEDLPWEELRRHVLA